MRPEQRRSSPEERVDWLAARGRRHPALVAVGDAGVVADWGSLNSFDPRPAYDHVADCSLYVAREQRGRGIGDAILGALTTRARSIGYHKMVLTAFPTNAPWMRHYERHGFTAVGSHQQQGLLDGRWIDTIVVSASWARDSQSAALHQRPEVAFPDGPVAPCHLWPGQPQQHVGTRALS